MSRQGKKTWWQNLRTIHCEKQWWIRTHVYRSAFYHESQALRLWGLRKRNVKVFHPHATPPGRAQRTDYCQHLRSKSLSRHPVETLRKNCPSLYRAFDGSPTRNRHILDGVRVTLPGMRSFGGGNHTSNWWFGILLLVGKEVEKVLAPQCVCIPPKDDENWNKRSAEQRCGREGYYFIVIWKFKPVEPQVFANYDGYASSSYQEAEWPLKYGIEMVPAEAYCSEK